VKVEPSEHSVKNSEASNFILNIIKNYREYLKI